MIIDTTISAMEHTLGKLRCLDQYVENKFRKKAGWHWPAEHSARIRYREAAIRDFLIKRGDAPSQLLNHSRFVFWENGEIRDVHSLAEPTQEAREKAYKAYSRPMLDKFVDFMQFILSNRRNQEPSK